MTAAELKALRQQTGLSQTKFADYLGIGYHSIRAYERSERPIPYPTDEFIKYKMNELAAAAAEEEERLNHELRKLSPQRKRV